MKNESLNTKICAKQDARQLNCREQLLGEPSLFRIRGWVRPVYIAGRVQPGPGDQAVLNCDWLLSGEAVDAAEAGEAGDASPKNSSSISVAGWFQARFQMRPDDDDAPSSSCGASFFGEALQGSAGEG